MKEKKKDLRFDDGAKVSPDFRDSGRRVRPRKSLQLCAQIRRALELALLGGLDDPVFDLVVVAAVTPCTDPGRVRVAFSIAATDPAERAAVEARIEAARGMLIAEVAAAIHRRKVPDLVFEYPAD